MQYNISPSDIATNLKRRDSLAKYRLMPLILDSLELHCEGRVATIYLEEQWLKQTGANYTMCEDIVNMVLNIGIVDIALFFRVSKHNIVRVSLRSKNSIDVSKIANKFNGGGHTQAAGCDCDTSDIFKAKDMLINFIIQNKQEIFNGK
jgi:phosphoesterase RecJ-like protein